MGIKVSPLDRPYVTDTKPAGNLAFPPNPNVVKATGPGSDGTTVTVQGGSTQGGVNMDGPIADPQSFSPQELDHQVLGPGVKSPTDPMPIGGVTPQRIQGIPIPFSIMQDGTVNVTASGAAAPITFP